MTEVYVDHLAVALGDRRQTVEESVRAGRTRSSADDLRLAGFETHWMCSDDRGVYQMAKEVVEELRPHLGRVDVMVYSTALPANGNVGPVAEDPTSARLLADYPASRLQAEIDLGPAEIIGVTQQACTGLLGSIRLARALIVSEPDCHRVLCVTSDRFPAGGLYEHSYNLISDGAAALMVTRQEGRFRLLASHQITNGALAGASEDTIIGMFFTFAQRAILDVLAKAKLTGGDIDWVVPQNLNPRAWQVLCRNLGISTDAIFAPTMRDVAHVISADNVYNLKELVRSGRLKEGDRLLLLMAGWGLNWQCVILEAMS